ncbi:MAG: hypothetical protein RPU35_10225 [Candidatus Sedimenticola sp. (ex Thyasira tokunagai)]
MRIKSRKRAKINSQRFARHFPSLQKHGDINTNVHMFTQDIQTSVMPIGGKSNRNPNFNVDLQGVPTHTESATVVLESLSQYSRHNLEELLSEAVSNIAQRLTWGKGITFHEIINDREGEGLYYLEDFTSKRLFHFCGKYIQVIPKRDRKLWGKTIVVVPDADVWKLSIPNELGGYQGFRSTLNKLSRFQSLGPTFWRDDLENQRNTDSFDLQRYVKETSIYNLKSTTDWGWDQRSQNHDEWTEFYHIYRILRFKWAQAKIREHIVKELNILFIRLGIEATIVVNGLPTSNEISTTRQRMLEGYISFSDAYDACSI